MSRSGDKKPVGFGTHIVAGGLAGAAEAVRPSYPSAVGLSSTRTFPSYVANRSIPSKSGCNSRGRVARREYIGRSECAAAVRAFSPNMSLDLHHLTMRAGYRLMREREDADFVHVEV